ncbi:hypothetical protein EX895_004814 [Sporisorium graminicola]|uniref:2',3'-cyclic-nucleotide 3'-phosphodiesterase n=1 Tax=Sporisorium graminicola TaxID=280036 RepID=A0A4V6ETM8_9BASI|nr:hypothetical protein EX895_004814 [Sporisorium graminicola]TKY85989.1 hypothetical protein EX895_004814 [Sporisorium graminicola]
MGLALWLVPRSSGFSDAVRDEMARLRAANAGVSSGEFGIHATLLAGLGDREISGEALRDVADEAVKAWKKQHAGELEGGLTVGLKDVTTRGSYFQCILIALAQTPAPLALNTITRRHVDHHFPPPDPPASSEAYFPHISLLYASLSATEAQTQIQDMRQQRIFTDLGKEAISFKGFPQVTFAAVDVYDCTGKPEDWVKLHSIPL